MGGLFLKNLSGNFWKNWVFINMDKLVSEEISRIKFLINEKDEKCRRIIVNSSTLESIMKMYLSDFDVWIKSYMERMENEFSDGSYMSKTLISKIREIIKSQIPKLHLIIKKSVNSGFGFTGPYNMKSDISEIMDNVFKIIKSEMNSSLYSIPLSIYIDSGNVGEIKKGLKSNLMEIFGIFFRKFVMYYLYEVNLLKLMNKKYCNPNCYNPDWDERGKCYFSKKYNRGNTIYYSFTDYIEKNIGKIYSEIDKFV